MYITYCNLYHTKSNEHSSSVNKKLCYLVHQRYVTRLLEMRLCLHFLLVDLGLNATGSSHLFSLFVLLVSCWFYRAEVGLHFLGSQTFPCPQLKNKLYSTNRALSNAFQEPQFKWQTWFLNHFVIYVSKTFNHLDLYKKQMKSGGFCKKCTCEICLLASNIY